MKKSRELAVQSILRVESDAAYINIILDTEFRKTPSLDPRDRALVTELVYGVVRWQKTLDWYLDQVCRTPMRKTHPFLRQILRVGAYQLLMLDKIPPSAAVNESVKLAGKYAKTFRLPAKTAKGFVNAALRRLQRERHSLQSPDSIADNVRRLACRYSFPEWLVRRWIQRLGGRKTEEACRAQNIPAPLILRVNSLKASFDEVRQQLTQHAESVTSLPPPLPGIAVSGAPPISDLRGYQQGRVTVQNASSLLIALILAPQPGEHILDTCAGSGVKTTHIAECMRNQGSITATDVHEGKLHRLQEHCQRLGVSNVQTVSADMTTSEAAPDIHNRTYDRILIDAPCTGLGGLRKHPEAKWTTQESQIPALQEIQRALLERTSPLLRPDGILVYSTCTTEPQENEEVVLEFLQTHPDFHIQPLIEYLPEELHQCLTSEGFLRIEPPQGFFDGFFCAKLMKVQ